MTFLKKIFTAPTFDDEIKSQQAYMLHIILWTLVCVPIAFFFYTFFLNPENLSRTITQAVFAEAVNIFLLFLLYRGYVRAASTIQVSAFWLFFTITAFTGGGVQGEAYLLGYGLVIGVAGILLGGMGASVFTVLSLIAGGLMVYNQSLGTITASYPSTPLTTWVVSLLLFPVGALLQYLASRTTRTALSRAQASEEKYRLISQVSSDYIFATEVHKDGSASLSWVAGAFEKMTEYNYEEYVATGGWLSHIHPEDLEKDAQDMEKLSKNQDVKSEIRSFTKNGEIRWEQIFAHPIWNEKENRLSGIFGAVRDITEQKQAEAALAYERDILQIFMDNIPDLVYFKDAESRFVRINQAQARFLGIDDPQDALGKTDLNFQNPEIARELLMQEKQIIETGQPVWNHLEFNPADGAPRWLSTTKVPAKNEFGQTIGIIGISRNITRQKLAEELEQNRRIMLEKVVKLGQNVTEVYDLRTTLERIWHGVHDDLGFDRLGIYLYNPKRNSMDGTFGTSIHGEMIDEWHTSVSLEQENLEAGLFLRLLENPNRTYLTHTYENDFNIPEGHTMSGVKDFAAIAASAGDKPVAVLCVDHAITGRPITEEQLEVLSLFAGYVGLAIENTRLNTALQSELSQHRETLLHQSAILNGIPDMAWLKDKNNRYVAVNEQFANTAGLNTEEIIGKTDFDIWQESLARMYHNDDLEVIQSRRRKQHIEELQTDSTGREYWVETTKTPIMNTQGEVIGTTGIAREITERKKAELERETLIAELEAKNAELERYTYTVSHDLKSPLVTIRGFLGYLEKDALAGNIQKIKDDIKRIENATQKMHALLNDLLELSRIGRLMNESTDMLFTDIAKDAIALVHGQIEARNVIIEIQDTPVILHGDRTRLTEVIQNLVDNAVKFMGDQPAPKIIIGATKTERNETAFFVRDNGIGIDSRYHERIFTLFNKLNASTEGTGIGLTLIKRIIEVHKGRIWLESEPGKGTTFYFTLDQT